MKRSASILMLFLTCFLVAAAPAPSLDEAVHLAETRGAEMFWYDRAAWVTTDDMLAKLSSDRTRDVGGWVVTPAPAQSYHVDYVGKGDAALKVIYSADVRGQTVSNVEINPQGLERPLGAMAAQMISALKIAREELKTHTDWTPCTNANFNTVVLPPDEHDVIATYFLSAMVKTGHIPFGGHFEIDVATDGSIAAERGFTKSCLTMEKTADATALFLNHLLDPQPTEIHVFQQFAIGVPLYVAAQGRIWIVDKGHIRQVKSNQLPAS